MQTRKHSLCESITNVIIGYSIALLSQIIIFPFFQIKITLHDNLLIGLWFTLISIIRSYTLRRIYNKISIYKRGS